MATTRAGKKALEARAPKIQENRKKSIFIKGRKASQVLNWVWEALALFRYGELVRYSQNNDITPFENTEKLDQYCQQHDCSLFTFYSSLKKRPDDLIFGRLYDGRTIEMYEFGIENYIGFETDKKLPQPNLQPGCLPALIFQGDEWETSLSPLRNYFIDFFVGDLRNVPSIEQLDHVLVLTSVDNKVLFRHYAVNLEGSTPALTQISPSFDMVQRRDMKPDLDTFSSALLKPSGPQKKKNVVKDDLGRDVGRVFVKKANLTKLRLKRFDGLRKKRDE